MAEPSHPRVISPSVHRRAPLGSTEVCSPVSASKEKEVICGIVKKTVETLLSIDAAMIATQESTFATFALK